MIKNKNLITLTILSIASSSAFSQQPVTMDIPSELALSNNYDPECYIKLDQNTPNLSLPNACSEYVFIDQSSLAQEQRQASTTQYFGLGFNNPYLLITSPHSTKETINLYDEFNPVSFAAAIDDVELETNIDLSARAQSSSSSNGVVPFHSKIVRQVIPLNQTMYHRGFEEAVFEYKLDFFASKPFYEEFGTSSPDNSKYVRVSLVDGPGINFYSYSESGKWVTEYKTFTPTHAHQFNYFAYRDYLDQVTISTELHGNGVNIKDIKPNNIDRNLTRFTKESSVDVKFGVSIPKNPLSTSISIASTQKITYESGDFMDFNVSSTNNSTSIKYHNRIFGTSVHPRENGYCDLIDNATGCWRHATSPYDAPFVLSKLKGTPYSNGFIPTFTTTYSAPYENTGQSTLSLKADIQGMALLGHARWAGGRLYFTGWKGKKYAHEGSEREFELHNYRSQKNITIDWSSPLFSGAQPVNLTSLYKSDTQAKCLTAASNDEVLLQDCEQGKFNQLFYYTPTNHNYVSAVDFNKCLTTSNGGQSGQAILKLEQCAPLGNNNQVWSWSSNSETFSVPYTQTSGGINILRADLATNDRVVIETVNSVSAAPANSQYDSRRGVFIGASVNTN